MRSRSSSSASNSAGVAATSVSPATRRDSIRCVSSPRRIAPAIRALPLNVCSVRRSLLACSSLPGWRRHARSSSPACGKSSVASSRKIGRTSRSTSSCTPTRGSAATSGTASAAAAGAVVAGALACVAAAASEAAGRSSVTGAGLDARSGVASGTSIAAAAGVSLACSSSSSARAASRSAWASASASPSSGVASWRSVSSSCWISAASTASEAVKLARACTRPTSARRPSMARARIGWAAPGSGVPRSASPMRHCSSDFAVVAISGKPPVR